MTPGPPFGGRACDAVPGAEGSAGEMPSDGIHRSSRAGLPPRGGTHGFHPVVGLPWREPPRRSESEDLELRVHEAAHQDVR